MALYRNAFYWFIALLLILIAGFWRSYFSKIGDPSVHWTHHLHGVSMLLWVLLLISQSWLIRNKRNGPHRVLGRISFLLAPVVFVSAIWVGFQFMEGRDLPLREGTMAVYWFGHFLAILFGALYVLAIVKRRQMQHHARYMVATALVFLLPGWGRAFGNYAAPVIGWSPSFFQWQFLPLAIGLWLLFLDWRGKRPLGPFLFFNVAWAINIVAWLVLPHMGFWQSFSEWTVKLMS